MKLEDIHSAWEKDGPIDVLNLTNDSANIPKLHHKYFGIYMQEGMRLKKMDTAHKELVKKKTEYYRGDMDIEEIKQFGWKPLDKHILKADVSTHVETDSDVAESLLRISMQRYKIEYLESIIHQIKNRNFVIKNIIDYERFKVGA